MVRRLTLIVSFLLIGGVCVPAQAQNWEFLGERHANLAGDHDVIPVGIRDGLFRTLQLRVRGNAIHLMDLRVNFRNGTTYDVPVRAIVRAGEQTRAIDLPGDLRVIRNVRMTYRTVGRVRRGQATVRLFGRRGSARPAVVAQPAQPTAPVATVQPTQRARAWELLGERVVNFRGDHDVIPVGVQDGRFRRIQLRVRGNAVHMMDLRVNFANGTTYDVPIRANIAAGGHTRAIDLPGNRRVIRNVRMTYRTRARRAGRGRATVRLFGSRN